MGVNMADVVVQLSCEKKRSKIHSFQEIGEGLLAISTSLQ